MGLQLSITLALLLFTAAVSGGTFHNQIYVVGPSTNDLLQLLLSSSSTATHHVANASTAITAARQGDLVLILADGYPAARTHIPPGGYSALERAAEQGGFGVYVEYPQDHVSAVPLSWKQRSVVTSSMLSEFGLDAMRILQLQDPVAVDWCANATHKCDDPPLGTMCAMGCNSSLLSFAQVAGVDRAAFGVSDGERIPLLVNYSRNLLVSSSPLSIMVTARFAPQDAWHALWTFILNSMATTGSIEVPAWTTTVHPTYLYSDPLPANATSVAVARSAKWISTGSTLMTVQSRGGSYGCCQASGGNQECTLHQCTWDQVCPSPYAPPNLTNVTCLQEGWSSIVHSTGKQHMMPLFIRTDGNAEAAMALAAAATFESSSVSSEWANEASQLLDYMFRWSDSQTFQRSNSSDPKHGIVWWNQQDAASASGGIAHWASSDYGSNSACVLMGATAVAGMLDTGSWRERMLYMLFAEIRTTGRKGNRPGAIGAADLDKNGWEHYFNDATLPSGASYSPHYGAQAAGYFAFAAHATGMEELFLEPAIEYVRGMMESLGRGEWRWTQSVTNELSTLLLTTAWLVRVDNAKGGEHTGQHRAWLREVADRLLTYQTVQGGIKQFFGEGNEAGKCNACPPTSNENYGSGEAPLMFDGSEPITDCLYSLNFAVIGLREAFGATGDVQYQVAEDKLVEYLVRIQVASEHHPELDGAWFRAFDYMRWEYWASDSDWGYGTWLS